MSGISGWTCHVCGDYRPDERISVHKRDRSKEFHLPEGTMQENVRYCNDREECIQAAQIYKHGDPKPIVR